MALTSPSEWAAGKFPPLHAKMLTDNLLQKSTGGGDQTVVAGVTFSSAVSFSTAATLTVNSAVTYNGLVTIASAASFNGNVTIGDGTADAHTLNGTLSMTSNGHLNVAPGATIVCNSTTQGSATALTQMFNILTTANTGVADSVRLPVASTGSVLFVMNQGVGTANVFPATGGTINGGSGDASVMVNPLAARLFIGHTTVNWASLNGAV